jgi:signal peptidase I
MGTFYTVLILLSIPSLIGLMKIFEKAGYSHFYALIPFYNAYIWVKVLEKPMWWLIFAFTPFLNVFMLFLMTVETAKTFNKNLLWEQALAAIFPFAYLPYLGFNKEEKYQKKSDRPAFKKSKLREWTDAIIFAVFAATIIRTFFFEAYTIPTPSMEKSMLVGDYLFVSKLAFGPKVPNTPIAFPFVHHTLPWSKTAKSYLEWIELPYDRYPGFGHVKNNDIVVFNYPDGDTVALNRQDRSYYAMVREFGWSFVNNPTSINPNTGQPFGDIVARPVDKRENYIKRCIAIAGDTLQIINQQVYINGVKAKNPKELETEYFIVGKDHAISKRELEDLGLSSEDISRYISTIADRNAHMAVVAYYLPQSTMDTAFTEQELQKIGLINLSSAVVEKVRNNPQVLKLVPLVYKKGLANQQNEIFPHSPVDYPWNQDNFGPLYIPKKGATVKINMKNIVLYDRIIQVYEGNDFAIKNDKIYINGKESTEYTFKMDYYWMMGDNRHNSADSRFWGFVPEDHVEGSPIFIWLSTDKDKKLFKGGIRWNRVFKIPE